ncbi:unnamed protein product [Dicrocoelium dendriticum]|nr:unnamed protein product [Dicrocoelium dendriticum]
MDADSAVVITMRHACTKVQLAEVAAVRSCTASVNLLVCHFAIDKEALPYRNDQGIPCKPLTERGTGIEPQWIVELKEKAEYKDTHVCFKPEVFYAYTVPGGILLITTTISTVVLATIQCRQVQKLRRRHIDNREDYLLAPSSIIASEMTPPTKHVEAAGRLDILADSAFYRGQGQASTRGSHKQAIIQDGYQKLANGLQPSLRASKGRPNTTMRGSSLWPQNMGGSVRRTQNRGNRPEEIN